MPPVILALKRILGQRNPDQRPLRIRLVIQARIGVEEHRLVSIGDDRRGIDALMIVLRVALVLIFIEQAIGTEPARNGLKHGIVARLLALEAVAVRAVHPVQRVSGFGRCLRAIGAEVGDNAVFAVVVLDLARDLAQLVALDLHGMGELLTPFAVPLRAGDGEEATGGERQRADFLLIGGYLVKALHGAQMHLLQFVVAFGGVGVFGHDARFTARGKGGAIPLP